MVSYKEIAIQFGVSKWTIQRKLKTFIPVMRLQNNKQRLNLFTPAQHKLIIEYLLTTKLKAKYKDKEQLS